MKQHILHALRLTAVCVVFFCGIYTIIIWAPARFMADKGEGNTITVNGKVVGYALEGQSFTKDKYFWGRPSAAGYNATAGTGTNKGPSNPDYLKTVQTAIDSFLVHNPGIDKSDIPSDLVTSSGSGLDPDISPAAAKIQVKRIAAVRGIEEAKLYALVDAHTDKPFLGLFGPSKINVLKLNIDLDGIK